MEHENYTKITKEEADTIILDGNSEYMPFLYLNLNGIGALQEWLDRVAAAEYSYVQWIGEAAIAADNCLRGEPIILEMHYLFTKSGNTETIIFDPACFDWCVHK